MATNYVIHVVWWLSWQSPDLLVEWQLPMSIIMGIICVIHVDSINPHVQTRPGPDQAQMSAGCRSTAARSFSSTLLRSSLSLCERHPSQTQTPHSITLGKHRRGASSKLPGMAAEPANQNTLQGSRTVARSANFLSLIQSCCAIQWVTPAWESATNSWWCRSLSLQMNRRLYMEIYCMLSVISQHAKQPPDFHWTHV